MEESLVSPDVLKKKDEGVEETVGQADVHSGWDLGTRFAYWGGGGVKTHFRTRPILRALLRFQIQGPLHLL